MARKRKATRSGGATAASTSANPDSDDDRPVKMNIRSWEDVADSEDEWDLNRDKILLEEGPAKKRQRRLDEEEAALEESGEEVLAVPDEFDEDEEDEEDEEEKEDEDEEEDGFEHKRGVAGDLKASSIAADLDDDDQENGEPQLEDEEGWGGAEAYGADVAENEEDAREIEAEAIRLQKKRLQGMTDADFGFDESEWLNPGNDEGPEASVGVHVEKLPDVEVTDEMSAEEKERLLKARYPEFEPLANEFLQLQPLAQEMRKMAETANVRWETRHRTAGDGSGAEVVLPVAVIKYNALAGYMATLVMYFAIFSSASSPGALDGKPRPIDPRELREHSIMDALVRSRNLWEKARSLEDDEQDEGGLDVTPDREKVGDETMYFTPKEFPSAKKAKAAEKPKRKKLSKAEKAALQAQAEAIAKREERLRKLDEHIAKLDRYAALAERNKTSAPEPSAQTAASEDDGDDSEFGDETYLTAHKAQEKARRKKSLRFYTSQIAQKVNKHSAVAANYSGDADLPYRERIKDRQARLVAEAEARGKKPSKKGRDADELGGPSDDEDRITAAAIREENGADDEYYQIITSRTASKKASDSARREAQKEAALRGAQVREVEEVGPDGKRAIGWTIEKNKGLTPHRKKDVRNPRVKKRRKFDEKKKKLGSIRQVYKGGEGRGGYGGELTGIKKGLVRAIKL